MKKTTKGLLFFLIYLLIIAGCATAPIDIDLASKPSEDNKNASNLESSLGQAGYYYMLLNFKMVADPKIQNRINRIGARLAYYTERPNIKYGYFIIDTKYRSAFSLPDGYIFISNSLIDTLKDDDKIAVVLAHEIAHITHKHMLNRLERFKNRNLIESVLGSMVFKEAQEMGRSQADELQADQTSLRYLYRAGYNLEAAITALEDLKVIEKEDADNYKKDCAMQDKKVKSGAPMTHPYIENRIVNTRNYLSIVKESEKILYKPDDFAF